MAFIKSSEFYFEICSWFNFCFQFHSFILKFPLGSVFSLSHWKPSCFDFIDPLTPLPGCVSSSSHSGSNSSSPRTSRQFWVPRASVERWVYHIESDVENKTSRSWRPPSLQHGRIVCPPVPWEFPVRTLPLKSSGLVLPGPPTCGGFRDSGSGWSFQMLHQCLLCWLCSSDLFMCT